MSGKIVAISMAVALAAPAAGAALNVAVQTVEARSLKGELVSLTDKALVLRLEDKDKDKDKKIILSRGQVIEIVLAGSEDILSMAGRCVLATVDGNYLAAGEMRLSAGRLGFVNPLLGRTSLPLARLRAIYRPALSLSAGELMRRCIEMKLRVKTADVLVVDKGGDKGKKGLVAVRGALKGIGVSGDVAGVIFRWQETDRRVALKSVRAILLAGGGGAAAPVAGVMTGVRGSTTAFTALTLAGGRFKANIPGVVGAVAILPSAVAEVRFTSTGAVELGSLKPLAVREHGFFDSNFPYRVNRSVAGGPIRMAGKTYRSGLGLHSFCELTYGLDGRYGRFVAVVGIDDAVRPSGAAELTVLADGRVLAGPIALTGRDKPETLRLNVAGARKLTIRVGFGADGLDVSDHVDLAAARLIPSAE